MKQWISEVVYNSIAVLLLLALLIPYVMGINGYIQATFYSFLSAYIAIVFYKLKNLRKDAS